MNTAHLDSLELLRATRLTTLSLTRDLTQAQVDFRPAADAWSVGQVLDHLLIAEKLYRDSIAELIQMSKDGRRPVIRKGFKDIDTSIAYIPKSLLPFLDVPFTILNMFVPPFVRETMAELRLLPAQNPKIAEPASGRPIGELRDALRDSFDDTAALLKANPNLDYRAMRYHHPLLGENNVAQLLRIVAFHERRHQAQIRDILRSRALPKAA